MTKNHDCSGVTQSTALTTESSRRLVLVAFATGIALFVGWNWIAKGRSSVSHPMDASLILTANHRDLGQISSRQDRLVPFQIRNAGSRRLVLNELDMGCGCGDRVQRTILIAPGESVEVNVALDTRFATGLVESVADFTTNDPVHPRFKLTVLAFVTAPVVAALAETQE